MISYVLNLEVLLTNAAPSSYPVPWLCPASLQPATPQNQMPAAPQQTLWKMVTTFKLGRFLTLFWAPGPWVPLCHRHRPLDVLQVPHLQDVLCWIHLIPRPALPPVSFSVNNTAIHPISKVEAQELSMTSFLPLTSQSDQMLSVLLSILQSISSSLPSPLETKPPSSLTYITHRLLATPCPSLPPAPPTPIYLPPWTSGHVIPWFKKVFDDSALKGISKPGMTSVSNQDLSPYL